MKQFCWCRIPHFDNPYLVMKAIRCQMVHVKKLNRNFSKLRQCVRAKRETFKIAKIISCLIAIQRHFSCHCFCFVKILLLFNEHVKCTITQTFCKQGKKIGVNVKCTERVRYRPFKTAPPSAVNQQYKSIFEIASSPTSGWLITQREWRYFSDNHANHIDIISCLKRGKSNVL